MMLHKIGLLSRGCENLVPYAMRLYKRVRATSEKKAGEKSGTSSAMISVGHLLGRCTKATMTDTALCISLGSGTPSHLLVWGPEAFPYTARNPSIAKIRHAVSLDERRWFFRQKLSLRQKTAANGQRHTFVGRLVCKQLWKAPKVPLLVRSLTLASGIHILTAAMFCRVKMIFERTSG